jgi:adenosine deaminase
METFIGRIPKAELHLHIEGTLEPEMVFALAHKHRLVLPHSSVAALRRAYCFSSLQSFLEIYYEGASVLRDADDFHALTSAYLRRAHADGVVHAEIFFDPQTHIARGVPFEAIIGGIHGALTEGTQQLGITHRLILCFLRDLSEDDAMSTLEQALPHLGAITAVGLDSAEAGHPPAKFAAVFARARAAGLLTVAHAGEEGPAEYVSEALDLLCVQRVDHGVRSEEDPTLLERLARERVPLTVCPLSNVRLRVFERMEDHNLKRLLQRGLCVTVNSDDPAYFGGYVAENYLAAYRALGLSRADIVQLASNSFEASFMPEAEKQTWLRKIREFEAESAAASP